MIPRIIEDQNIVIKEYKRKHNQYGREDEVKGEIIKESTCYIWITMMFCNITYLIFQTLHSTISYFWLCSLIHLNHTTNDMLSLGCWQHASIWMLCDDWWMVFTISCLCNYYGVTLIIIIVLYHISHICFNNIL